MEDLYISSKSEVDSLIRSTPLAPLLSTGFITNWPLCSLIILRRCSNDSKGLYHGIGICISTNLFFMATLSEANCAVFSGIPGRLSALATHETVKGNAYKEAVDKISNLKRNIERDVYSAINVKIQIA